MNRNLYIRIGLFLLALLPLSISAQCVTRNVTNCKNSDPNQAIGAAMQGFFTDGSTGSFQWYSDATHPSATISECADGSATLTGTLAHFGNTARLFRVNVQFVRRSCTLAPGATQETNNMPAGTSTAGWYYYEWGAATMTGEGQCAGATLNLVQHMMPAQAGVNAANQLPDVGKHGLTGWFGWQVVTQPSNNWLFIAPYANGISDFCFVMDGPAPTYCNAADPCATFPTPSVTTTNATNGAANGCINITNLPTGASSSINGGAATAGKTQYCGLAPGTYTITVTGGGCTKSATATVGNTTNNPCSTVTGNSVTKSCVNNLPVLTGPAPSGSSTGIEYQWLVSTTSCPTAITQSLAGATSATLSLPSRVTVTTYYVRCARPIGCTTWVGYESNCLTVLPTDCVPTTNPCPAVTGNTVTKSCVNNLPVMTGPTPSGSSTGIEYQWLVSTTSCPTSTTQSLVGATSATLSLPSRVAVTTYYVRCARPIGCTTWVGYESNCLTVLPTDCAPVVGGNDICTSPATNIIGGSGSISITGITTSAAQIQVFNSSWSPVYSQQVSTSTVTIPNLAAGSYIVKVTVLGAGGVWPAVCDVQQTVTVGGAADPCTANPVPTPTTTVSNATNGGANGCINITNLPAGATSSINGGAATAGQVQYCGLATGTYTITVNLNGCIKSVSVTVGNTNTDPCITNPVATPTTTVSNATNGASNGCINITNLPAGATSSINGGAATAGQVQYCGLAAGTYTITVNLNGCIKTASVVVGNTNTDPCITNPVAAPTTTVSNATNGAANGCINITNLPAGATSSINGGAATAGKVQYCGLAAGTYTITVNLNGCIKTATVVVGNNNTDPCITNPVATPTTTTSNATNGGATGCINITNLPAGATSSINGGAATAGKVQYCGLTPGTYTITVNLNGCIKTVSVVVGNTVNCSVTGNTIAKSCVNNVPVITGSALTGYEFMWLSSTTGCPTASTQAIAGATGQHYNLPSRVAVTTYFVRCARPIGCTVWATVNESACLVIYPTDCAPVVNCNSVVGNTIAKSCVNNIPALTGAALAGYEYVWLSSTSGCPSLSTQMIAGATGQHYNLPSRVSVTTYFVRCARPIGCTVWGPINESNCITVNANECAPANPCITFDPTKCYKIVNRLNGRVLDVSGWSQSNDAAINTWGYNNQANQQWKIQSVGGGYYKIMSRNSGKVLANHSTVNNSNCYQYDYYTGGAKDWTLTCNAEGYFTIKHRLSNRVLDLKDAGNSSTADGCSTVIYDADGTNSQQWQVVEVACAAGYWSATATELLSMDAKADMNRARLEWLNNTGFKNDFFTVEKMNTSGNFETLEIQNTIYSGSTERYLAYDKNPTEGDNFYRVGVTYEDGTTKYSETKKVTFSKAQGVGIYPNPADDYIDLDLNTYKGSPASIFLYNSFGQQVQFMNIEKVGDGTTRLDVAAQSSGNYILRVASKDKRDVTKQIIISK
jgi:hypothetical protein